MFLTCAPITPIIIYFKFHAFIQDQSKVLREKRRNILRKKKLKLKKHRAVINNTKKSCILFYLKCHLFNSIYLKKCIVIYFLGCLFIYLSDCQYIFVCLSLVRLHICPLFRSYDIFFIIIFFAFYFLIIIFFHSNFVIKFFFDYFFCVRVARMISSATFNVYKFIHR